MNKKIKVIATIAVVTSFTAILSLQTQQQAPVQADNTSYHVDFFNNYLRQPFVLSNGYPGVGNNVLYQTVEVPANSLVTKPADPTRRNYEFKGWYKEEACTNEWDFAMEKVTHNTRLFACWGVADKEQMEEPPYTPPSTVLEESAATDYVINSVMNFKVNDGILRLPTAGIMKLEANSENVLPLMEYKVKASKEMTATFDGTAITVTCNGATETILVKNNYAEYVLTNSTYEGKAKNYEAKAATEESYHVMLAGSSSIEFWTSSKEDLDPIVSYNHGIGGTTIEEWDTCLNQRLVFPYKPKMVVYYVGINNVINSKQNTATVWSNLKRFFDNTHKALPDTKVQYILMNLIPGYTSYFDTINAVNDNVIEYQKTNNSWLTLINPGVALLKENGQPNAAYFRTDGLHLSNYGYLVWGAIVKESILFGLENYY